MTELEKKTEIKQYLVFLKRDPRSKEISVRVSLTDSYLRETENEFAAYVIEADSEANAAFAAAQSYFASVGVGLCELWVEEGINALRDWDWTYDENILNGVEMAKKEFGQFLDEYDSKFTPDDVELPELKIEELDD